MMSPCYVATQHIRELLGTIVLNNYADFIGEQAFQKKNPLFRLRGPMVLGLLT